MREDPDRSVPTVVQSFTTPDGLQLSYRLRGRGPLLVCHPGGPGFSAANLERLGGLDEQRTLVLLDPRGTGASQRPRDATAYALADYASDLDALRDELGVGSIDVLGHSHGSLVGLTYAAGHPERVDRLVLVGVGARWHTEQLQAMVRAVGARSGEPWFADAVAALGARPDPDRSDEQRAELLRRTLPFYFAGLGESEWAWIERHSTVAPHAPAIEKFRSEILPVVDLRPALGRITASTLVVAGSADFVTSPDSAREVATGIAGSELVELSGVGHYPWVEAPERFAHLVARFLGDGPRP